MKEVEVHFANARDVLGAYWGHLTGGGVAVDPRYLSEAVCEGQAISLRVCVDRQRRAEIPGTVVRATPTKAIVAFAADDGKRLLLSAAFSESCLTAQVRIQDTDADGTPIERPAQLEQFSDAGCCVHIDDQRNGSDPPMSVGSNVVVEFRVSAEALQISGCVVEVRSGKRWILFDADAEGLPALRRYLDGLSSAALVQSAAADSALLS